MSLHRITTPGSIELLDEAVLAQVPHPWMTMIQRELYGHALLAAEGALSMLTWVEDFVPEDNIGKGIAPVVRSTHLARC